jgi:hypothetical protein
MARVARIVIPARAEPSLGDPMRFGLRLFIRAFSKSRRSGFPLDRGPPFDIYTS